MNLQFPAGWENAKRIKYAQGYTGPAPRDYVGEAPLTAPESEAVYAFTRSHDFRLILAYHTQGEVIYWKYLDYEPAHSYEIAQYFGRVSGYTVEETPTQSGYAGYKDWFIQEYDRPGYTIEDGRKSASHVGFRGYLPGQRRNSAGRNDADLTEKNAFRIMERRVYIRSRR